MKNPLLILDKVGLKASRLSRPILNNINYNIYAKDLIILLGHNGSGKSSLLKAIDRRYHITHGEILFQGKNLTAYPQKSLAKHIITLTQNYQETLFSTLTVLENCILVKQAHESNFLQISSTKERVFFTEYLKDFNQNLTKKLDVAVINLSGGEQQALTLALNILYPPKILLLDEHTSALDPQASIQLMQITSKVIHKYGITCVLSTHDLDLALNYGNRILVLSNGETARIIEHDQKKLLKAEDLFNIYH